MNKQFFFLMFTVYFVFPSMNNPLLLEVRDFESEFRIATCRGIVNKCRWFASGIMGVPSAVGIIAGESEVKIVGMAGLTAAVGIWWIGKALVDSMDTEEKLEKIYALVEQENNPTILKGALEIINDIQNRRVRKTRWFIFDINFLFFYYLLRCDHSSTEKELGLIRAALIMRLDEFFIKKI